MTAKLATIVVEYKTKTKRQKRPKKKVARYQQVTSSDLYLPVNPFRIRASITTSPVALHILSDFYIMDNDNDLLYVHPTTLTCALTNTCLPCLYKLFPDGTIPCQEVLKLSPNQRPENCPRSQPHTTYSGLYTAAHRILTVGDGDFSFSLSLANGIQSINNTTTTSSSSSSNRGRCQLTATSHESLAQLHITYESVGIVDKLSQLHAHGVTVLHGVDATQLAATSALHQERYDVIVWNFPCVRAPKGADGQTTEIDINKQLLRDFFRNAHNYLTPHGQPSPC